MYVAPELKADRDLMLEDVRQNSYPPPLRRFFMVGPPLVQSYRHRSRGVPSVGVF